MRYRMKRLLAELLSAVILLSLLPAMAWAAGDFPSSLGGTGDADDPYQISTAEQLRQLSEYVNGGNDCENKYFQLTGNVDLGGEGAPWTPIGNANNRFKGSFDGDDHTISGLYINSEESYLGLFGYIGEGGTVKNLGVSGSVTGQNMVGGIAGYNHGTIENCHNDADVTGIGTVGGIAGNSYQGQIKGCYNTGAVSGHLSGGIVGSLAGGQVQNCYNTGAVSGTPAGGIVGDATEGGCENCYNTGRVAGSDKYSIGGIVGTGGNDQCKGCYYLKGTAMWGWFGDTGNVGEKTADEFRSLASLLNNGGDAWEDDPFLGRPVLKANKEPWPISGSGTESDPYLIPDKETLENFRNYVNAGNNCKDMYFRLTENINLESQEWTPIGENSGDPFKGTFDGNNKTISGLYINNNANDGFVGLFGYISDGSTVKNLTVEGEVNDSAYISYVGGIVGVSDGGTIDNCLNAAAVTTSSSSAGGIVGSSQNSAIKNCRNTGTIHGGGSTGGIVGTCQNGGTIENCHNTADITSSGVNAGGVVGVAGDITVINCSNTGAVSGTINIGGVAGQSGNNSGSGVIRNSYNTGAVTGTGETNVGGVVGSNGRNCTTENCYNTGAVNAKGGVGGVAGNNSGTVKNCYNYGAVEVTTEYGRGGGVVGLGTCTDCYYLEDTAAAGTGAGSDSGTTKKTADEFASGEVAYLLQSGQDPQVWGQDLTVSPDNYPVLTNAPEKKVYKVTFQTQDKPDYAASYTNQNGTVALPANPELTGMTFEYWSTTDSPSGDAKFDESTPVTADVIVYAVGRPTFGGEGDEIDLRATFGEESTADLSAYVHYESTPEDPAAGKFTYEIKEDNNDLKPTIDGDKLTIPGTANVGSYILTIVATEITPQYSLMSMGPYGTDPVTLTVKVTIEKADSKAQTPPVAVAGLAYTGEEQALVTAGTPVGGTMQYSLDGQSYSTDIPKGADAKEYTVWYKVVGDANHNDSTPQSVTVTIGKADGTGTLTMEDFTCKETGVEPEATSDTNGPDVTFYYAERGTENFTDKKPDTAGFYTVRAEFPENQNYNKLILTADFKITHQFNAGWEQTEDGEYHLCACGVGLLLETKELTEVPVGLKQNPDVDTVEEIEQVLVKKVATGDHYVIYDVELEAWTGDEWQIITPENLPEEGVAITIPYPKGTNSRYTFTVVHMFTTAGDGHVPGDTETLNATNEADGIHFTVKSFSPIIVGWKTGNLTVTVTDTGEGAGSAQQWQFRVELDDDTIDSTFGDMEFTGGVATFTLASGQSLTASDLPEGLAYTVTELNENQNGYTTTYTDDSGFITSEQDMIAAFVNDKPAQAKPDKPSDGPDNPPDTPTVNPPDTPTDTPPDTPTSNNPNDTPKTGDESHLALWFSLIIVSLLGITVIILTPIIGRKKLVSTNGRHMRK